MCSVAQRLLTAASGRRVRLSLRFPERSWKSFAKRRVTDANVDFLMSAQTLTGGTVQVLCTWSWKLGHSI